MAYYIETTVEGDIARWYVRDAAGDTTERSQALLFPDGLSAHRYATTHGIEGVIRHMLTAGDWLQIGGAALIVAAFMFYVWFFCYAVTWAFGI